MERRDFFRILSTSAAAVTTGCGSKSAKLLPLLVPEHELVPGQEQWHPAVCTGCGGGCGTLVRVMEGERITTDNGEPVRERVAAIKKIEGNPLDPVSGGRLCARGQAAVQSLYHPDRLRSPMQRSGDRGSAKFSAVTWDAAITSTAAAIAKADPSKIVILTGGTPGLRSTALARFAKALNAPPPIVCSISDHPLERKAAEAVFGWQGQPFYDLANANFILGVGADFLGGWTSPVYYARQFGHFRQGRRDVRGRLVQAESRLSITAASADQWLPVRPGTEVQFLAAVGRILIDNGHARNIGALPKLAADLFRNADAKALLAACGLPENRVREVVRDLGESPAPLVVGGASVPHAHSLDSIVASHYLNVLLGNVGKPGGVLAPAPQAVASLDNHRAAEALRNAQVILIDGVNPAYLFPAASGLIQALKSAASVIAFGSFVDDSGAWADLILPDHDPLESEVASVPSVSRARGMNAASPFILPLHDTRAVEQTLADLASKLQITYQAPNVRGVVESAALGELPVEDILHQGGGWNTTLAASPPAPAASVAFQIAAAAPPNTQFPLEFQPYLSLQHHDGSASNLPWMQELPDPVSSSIRGLPIELDPKTAAQLKVVNGDIVRVESPFGSLEAPAYVHPAAIPGVVSMPIGDGHSHYGRYATGRGANPLSILAAAFDTTTGALLLGGTRVKVSRLGDRKQWIQFSAPDREERDDHR